MIPAGVCRAIKRSRRAHNKKGLTCFGVSQVRPLGIQPADIDKKLCPALLRRAPHAFPTFAVCAPIIGIGLSGVKTENRKTAWI